MKTMKIVLSVAMAMLFVLAMGCDDSSIFPTEITDSRDGQVYKTVKIGDQYWLDRAMNFESENSWCYNKEPANCEIYGRLYTWDAALTACPEEWHLPTYEDLLALFAILDPDIDPCNVTISDIAGGKMKSTGTTEDGTGLWDAPNVGATNSSEFNALPAGIHSEGDVSQLSGLHGIFWSATENDDDKVWFFVLDYGVAEVFLAPEGDWGMTRGTGVSVRCISDKAYEPYEPQDCGERPDVEPPTDPNPVLGNMTDARDDQTYQTVTLGNQTWLAENLNYDSVNSWCYNDDPANCTTYGRMYTWAAAMTACPTGWSLATKDDWFALSTYLDPETKPVSDEVMEISTVSGEMIKSPAWPADEYTATNVSEFSALPGGTRKGNASSALDGIAMFWSATETESNTEYAWTLMLDNLQTGFFLDDTATTKDYALSVRCIED